MIKTVFLDLDDTILDFQRGERIALCGAFDKMNINCNDAMVERYIQINLDCWRALEQGEMTRDEVLIGRFERLFRERGIDASATEVQEIYENLLAEEHDFLPGGLELLQEFSKTQKYSLYMATNGIPDVQKPRIRDAKIASYFKKIFISEEIGYAKPDRRFFEECFKQIENFNKDEAIIIGDSLTSDIKGGINAGIRTCHFNRFNKNYTDIKPDYFVNHLSEVIPLLDSIE